jgi:hypothetical protein
VPAQYGGPPGPYGGPPGPQGDAPGVQGTSYKVPRGARCCQPDSVLICRSCVGQRSPVVEAAGSIVDAGCRVQKRGAIVEPLHLRERMLHGARTKALWRINGAPKNRAGLALGQS